MEKKLLKESKWLRVFELPNGDQFLESKFLVDRIQVNLEELIKFWELSSDQEKWELAEGYVAKQEFSEEDERIVEFLMNHASEPILSILAPMMAKHSNRHKITSFFLERIEHIDDYPKANYFQALEDTVTPESKQAVVAALKRRHRQYQLKIQGQTLTEKRVRRSDDIWDYLACCRILLIFTNEKEYAQILDNYSTAGDPQLRDWAHYLAST